MVLLCGVAFYFTSRTSSSAGNLQIVESVVFVGEAPVNLAFAPLRLQPIHVRSTYRDGLPQTVHYEQDRDYILDASNRLRRTPNSRIPDFRTNVLYGKKDFNHTQITGIGNEPYFAYVDYSYREKWSPLPQPTELGGVSLPNARKKLSAGEKIRIVAFGDSITSGAEASVPGMVFWVRWADALRQKYPRSAIETINSGTGGDMVVHGLQRIPEKVLAYKPDIVLIGFGMNDNVAGVSLGTFASNLRMMIDRVRADNGAEIILLSTFPPNPNWHFGSHDMSAYAVVTRQVALEKHCAYADVYHTWLHYAKNKKPEDLLNNNINHPNDFGHWIYFQALAAINI